MSLKPIIPPGLYQSSSGGGTIPSTTNLLSGDGAGNAANSGIAPANVALLTGNAFTGANTTTLTGLGTTPTAANSLINSTAAAAGAQQVSPSSIWRGNGWKTNATAASQTVDFRAYVLPIQGSSAPTGEWRLGASINGGAFSDVLQINNTGTVVFQGSATLPSSSALIWAGKGGVSSSSNGYLTVFTSGFALNASVIVGAGDPESAYTAPVGSLFLRTDGGSGTTIYAKESGSGNTGWSAL